MQILIFDFDFFSTRGGGQTFYRRLVERHPSHVFYYPSRGLDLAAEVRQTLPSNARPFVFDQFVDVRGLVEAAGCPSKGPENYLCTLAAQVAVALQGYRFDVVELPSFTPAIHIIRRVFSQFGIPIGRMSLGLLGWLSVGIKNAYSDERKNEVFHTLRRMEEQSLAAADLRYTISDLHLAENAELGVSITTIDMHDALETFALPNAYPPGSGVPDLWYVGRLDRNKGPDLFLDIVARIPRHLYRSCYLTGLDNPWSQARRWSELLAEQARGLGVDAHYLGELGDEELRERVYKGRNVLLIPSRSDSFNYVALEALVNGCPLLLSKHAGAAQFLMERHPRIAPRIIDPEDVDGSAASLEQLLENYRAEAEKLRFELRTHPLPQPKEDFLVEHYLAAPHTPDLTRSELISQALGSPAAVGWRTAVAQASRPDLSVIIVINDGDANALCLTLVSLVRQSSLAIELIVVADGPEVPRSIGQLISTFLPWARVLWQERLGTAAAFNRGAATAAADFLVFLTAGDGVDLTSLSVCVERLRDQSDAVGSVGGVLSVAPDGTFDPATLSNSKHASYFGPEVLYRRSGFEKVGGFNIFLTGTIDDLNDRLSTHGSYLSVPEVTAWRWISP